MAKFARWKEGFQISGLSAYAGGRTDEDLEIIPANENSKQYVRFFALIFPFVSLLFIAI